MSLKPNIYIPIEIMYRELTSRVYLAGCLAKAGYRIYVGGKIGIFNLIKNKKIKEGIFFYKSAFSQSTNQTLKLIKKCDHTVVLDEEMGLAMGNVPAALQYRIVNLNHISKFFVIGKDLEKKIKIKAKLNKNKIIASGWPKYDLCKKKYLKYYFEKAKKIKKKYGKFYLFASNFGILNKEILEERKKNKLYKKKYNRKNMKVVNEIATNAYSDYKNFIRNVNDYSKNNKTKIIIRPHPGDISIDNWNNDIKTNNNLKVIYKDDITPWIIASEGLIHRGCGTSIEAMIFNKKLFYFLPSRRINNYEKNIPFKISNKIKHLNTEKLKKTKIVSYKLKRILKNNVSNYDKTLSSDIIIKHLNVLKTKKTEKLHSFQVDLKLTEYLGKIKNVFRKNKINQKMPDLMDLKLIKDKMKNIFNLDDFNIKILGGETFEIEYKKNK